MLKRFCQCIGLAALILVMNYGDLLGGGADVRMHVPFALGSIVAAQIAGIVILGAAIFLLVILIQRTRFYGWVRLLLAIVVPPFLLKRMEDLMHFGVGTAWIPVFGYIWAALLLLLLLEFPVWYRRLLRVGDAIGIFFAAFAAFSILGMLWVAHWKPGPYQRDAAWETSPQPPRNHPLLIWVVFDELSYDQLFEHRARDLELPNFDALRKQSTLFTDVQPVGYKTVKIIPSLLTGQTVDDFRFRFDNSFLVHYTGQHGWHPITGQQTIFHDAQSAGWRTAAVGWYNPYCTTYGDAIDNCYWMNLDRIDGLMSQRDSFYHNTLKPLKELFRGIGSQAQAEREVCNYDVRQRIKTHLDLQQHATELIHTDQADFVFLHLAVPHSPNIWSRLDDDYAHACGSSYLDNLALADHVLGNLLSQLQASPRWKDTTLIIEGDHSWRVDLWNWQSAWTDEDDTASHSLFDPRPALIVHNAGQSQPATVSTPWPLLNLHNLVENVVHNQPVRF